MMKRHFSTWIKDYANLPLTSRLSSLQSEILPQYYQSATTTTTTQHSIIEDLTRSKHALKTAFAIRSDISSSLMIPTLPPEQVNPLKKLDKAVQQWLAQALSLDCLEHQRITFENSSGHTLEKVARGESVHRVRSLSELKRRLHDGKRCFAFFHPSLSAEPLVFVHVALTTELSASLSSLDSHKEEQQPTHAIFYSINSPHNALRKTIFLSILNLFLQDLIKQRGYYFFRRIGYRLSIDQGDCAVATTNFPHKGNTTASEAIIADVVNAVLKHKPELLEGVNKMDKAAVLKTLSVILTDERLEWANDKSFSQTLREPLLRLGAHYIAIEKRESSEGVVPLDDVARFHLRNGSVFHSINWMGNPSGHGLNASAGMMVNYLYDFNRIEENAARFGKKNEVIPMGEKVRNFLRLP
eukprot:scaffold3776_cov166-Ochromonas_danica.AAC.4